MFSGGCSNDSWYWNWKESFHVTNVSGHILWSHQDCYHGSYFQLIVWFCSNFLIEAFLFLLRISCTFWEVIKIHVVMFYFILNYCSTIPWLLTFHISHHFMLLFSYSHRRQIQWLWWIWMLDHYGSTKLIDYFSSLYELQFYCSHQTFHRPKSGSFALHNLISMMFYDPNKAQRKFDSH